MEKHPLSIHCSLGGVLREERKRVESQKSKAESGEWAIVLGKMQTLVGKLAMKIVGECKNEWKYLQICEKNSIFAAAKTD